MPTTQRNYKTKDVDMLVTASTILESAITNKSFLQSRRSTWADPFFDDLKARIETAVQTYLGIDTAKELRQATSVLSGIQKQAIKNLAECKVQIIEDFKKEPTLRDEILAQLGFSTNHKEAQTGDQEALIKLLYQFKKNLTPELQTLIVNKGTAPETLNTITAYADALKNANVNQETYKGVRKTITDVAINEFNEIYDAIISICKIAVKFYSDNELLQEQFSFSKVSKTLSSGAKATKPPTQPKK